MISMILIYKRIYYIEKHCRLCVQISSIIAGPLYAQLSVGNNKNRNFVQTAHTQKLKHKSEKNTQDESQNKESQDRFPFPICVIFLDLIVFYSGYRFCPRFLL
jgi:hypothetical protein